MAKGEDGPLGESALNMLLWNAADHGGKSPADALFGAIMAIYDDYHDNLPQKMRELCQRYKIAPAEDGGIDWRSLAIALAVEHEPGFRPPRKRGPKDLTNRDVMLILDVEKLQSEKPDRSDSAAVNILVTSPRFAKRWGGETKHTLENALGKARKDQSILVLIDSLREKAREIGEDLWTWLDRAYQRPVGRNAPRQSIPKIQK